ncbi:hypothetical protein M513_12174 [Trichuris suis]|uniref:FLYWCH-type domain-containing protein n=2 Tax=Trichuris suis TaxID=68888 RepID=A0A085LPN2_9BILA|nr:hypothetical protein M513_12174 [Trichuris suis]
MNRLYKELVWGNRVKQWLIGRPSMEVPTMTRVLSQRQREKMVYLGYSYCFDKLDLTGTVKFWRCDKRHSDGCKARIHTLIATGEVTKRLNDHTHGSDAAGVEVAALVSSVRRRAEETLDTGTGHGHHAALYWAFKHRPPPTRDPDRKQNIIWCLGQPGSGKTHYAMHRFPNAYIKGPGQWWNGFQNQEDIIIDEIAERAIDVNELLQVCDNKPIPINIKHSSAWLYPKNIIICSMLTPYKGFPKMTDTHARAIHRRFTEIILCRNHETHPIRSVETSGDPCRDSQ